MPFRPPEWQQNADRHTQLTDPVLTVRQLSRFEFSLRTYVRIDHALVFSTARGGYEAYLPPRRPTRADIAANRYTAVYEVDMGVHTWTAELTLPSDNDAFEFTAQVELSWQVLDPARFVASGHRDVPGLLVSELQQSARPVTRGFAIADSAAAEHALLERMRLLGPLGAPAGLQVSWTLRLRRDQEDIDHQRRLQAIDHSATEQIRAAQRGMEVDAELDTRARQQDAFQIERAMAFGTQQHQLFLDQQRRQHELAVQQSRMALEMQQYQAQKIAFYQAHLQQGGVHALALHLADHPEDSRLVMNSMRDDQLRLIQAQMDLVKQLLGGNAAENWELEGPKQLALRTVHDILNQRLPGVAHAALPPQPDGPPPPGPGTAGPGPVDQGRVQGALSEGGESAPPAPSSSAGPTPPPPPAPSAPPNPPAAPAAYAPAESGAPMSGPAVSGPAPSYSGAPGPYGTPGPYGSPGPYVAPAPYGTPGVPGPQPAEPRVPLPPSVPPPGAPTPYPYSGTPGSYPGAQPPLPPAAPAAPGIPAWQPPPGYGLNPTLPVQDAPDTLTDPGSPPRTGSSRPGSPEESGT